MNRKKTLRSQATLEYFIIFSVFTLLTLLSFSSFFLKVKGAIQGTGTEKGIFERPIFNADTQRFHADIHGGVFQQDEQRLSAFDPRRFFQQDNRRPSAFNPRKSRFKRPPQSSQKGFFQRAVEELIR